MNEIVPEFSDSLVIDSADILSDYLELGIDSVLENDNLKEIPIVKTFISVGRIARNIGERNLLKNLVIFINELNSGSIDKEKLRKHKEELNKNSKKAEKELGRVLIILEQTLDNIKSSILGKLYKAYINQEIDWDLFVEFSEVTNRLYINDLNTLKMIFYGQLNDTTNSNDLYRIERLNSLGVIGLAPKAIFIGNTGSRQDSYITLNNVGKIYSNIIFINHFQELINKNTINKFDKFLNNYILTYDYIIIDIGNKNIKYVKNLIIKYCDKNIIITDFKNLNEINKLEEKKNNKDIFIVYNKCNLFSINKEIIKNILGKKIKLIIVPYNKKINKCRYFNINGETNVRVKKGIKKILND